MSDAPPKLQRLNTQDSDLNTVAASTLRTISNSDVFIAKISAFWRDEVSSECQFVFLFIYFVT